MDLSYDNIRFVPCVHRRVTFAEQVRRVALEWRPDAIAVELPETLREWIVRGVLRLPQVSAVCWEEPGKAGELSYLPIDPCDAIVEAVRLGCEYEIPVEYIDLDLPRLQEAYRYVPDDVIVDTVGLDAFVEKVAPYVRTADRDAVSRAREMHMARRLKVLAATHERVLCVIGMAHYLPLRGLLQAAPLADADPAAPRPVSARPGAFLAHVGRSSLLRVLGEIPYLAYLFEQGREELDLTGRTAFDKFGAIQSILRIAGETYAKTYKEKINLTQWKALLQYTRNLSLVRGRLRPDFYEVVVGARGIVDGDYGYEVYELARTYPPQDDKASELPKLTVVGGQGLIEGRAEQFNLRPRWAEPPAEMIRIGFRRRPPRELKRHWREQWQRALHLGICSWPPEDELQERFMQFIRKRALQVMTEDRKQVQEFKTSLLDGLDIRETMRNWHTGQIYVQSTPQPQGKCGAVVMIFQDEPLGAKGSWRTTLYAENQNESDISFFASPLGEHVVGPRICRTEFGGILSIYPPLALPDIWSFQLIGELRLCSEALLAAAIVFSPDRYIAYVAHRPPRSLLRQLAANYGKHLVYLPLNGFSPGHLKKIRHFHILDGHDVRAWARDYIFED